ncbi:MAG: IS1634 family transposase [Rikenellaceae bacterium]
MRGKYKQLVTIGISSDTKEIDSYVLQGKEWIRKEELCRRPELDFEDNDGKARKDELERANQFISQIDNIILNGSQLILDKVFEGVGFNQITDEVFRQLIISRLSFPASKAATVEYLKNHFDEDLDLSKIYRYLDRLNSTMQELVQDISVKHTMELFGGNIGVMFYDVTTLYFESDYEDDLRKTGFSKDGRHSNPQIILGLLVSLEGYPLAHTIHEGNKYEGHIMLPVIQDFVNRYDLDDFIVVVDSGLMNTANITELEALGYKYIIGARIKNTDKATQDWILSQPKRDRKMVELNYANGRRLLVGYTDDRAKKDSYNRKKGIKRLEKAYHRGQFTKSNLNKKGYNKFLEMKDSVKVTINYDKIEEDSRWDGLKGYLTNTSIPTEQVYAAYHNLWNVEKAFRIAKSKIEIRPMFHFTRKRIEAHICICFVALKVYKELERILKLAEIGMSVDKVLNMAKTVTILKLKLPLNGEILSKTMIMKRHKRIKILFNNDFWGTQ